MIKKSLLLLLIGVLAFFANVQTNAAASSGEPAQNAVVAHVRIAFNDGEVIVGLFDNSASRDLLAQLPLSLAFSDYAGAEKIAYPPKALNTRNTPSAGQITGDFTYYAPWGNLAVFYKGHGSSGDLYVLGRIESGKDKLARMNSNFTAVIEKID